MNRSTFGFKGGLEVRNLLGNKLSAFTLIELLVVLATVVILGVLLPALAGTQVESKVTACKARYRQWAASANLYANDNQGWLPLRPGAAAPTSAGGYAVDVSTNLLDALYPYGMNVPQYFCPMRPSEWDAANAWGLNGSVWAPPILRHPIQSINDLELYLNYPSECRINDNYWVKRPYGSSGVMYPNSDIYMTLPSKAWPIWLRQGGTPTFLMYGWPQRLHDKAAPYVPFVSDSAGQIQPNKGGGGLIPNPNWNGVVGDPSEISPNTAHFVNGTLLGVNLAFADGHAASHAPDQIRCVYQDLNTGQSLWFY